MSTRSPVTIIVQAGGRGSRLRHHTWNKPKCLVSVDRKPILYHLFDSFPTAQFIIIGDYAYPKLQAYLRINPPAVSYQLVRAKGKGTLAGMIDALALCGADDDILLIWSDLRIHSMPDVPAKDKPLLFLTDALTCRWQLDAHDGRLREEASNTRGVPGIIYFPRQCRVRDLPRSGEFIKWWAKDVAEFDHALISDIEELGDFDVIENNRNTQSNARFFNQVEFDGERVIKRTISQEFEILARREQAWYRAASAYNFKNIPEILDYDPLVMKRVDGLHPFQMQDLRGSECKAIVERIIASLQELHTADTMPADPDAVQSVYLGKTRARVNAVMPILPFKRIKTLTINGKKCRNIFAKEEFLEEITTIFQPQKFTPIHGDPTFCNIMIDAQGQPIFIDPRGYFADDGIFGDPLYDIAKLYYSVCGNYDDFNLRNFKLYIDNETVEILLPVTAFCVAHQVFAEHFPHDMPYIRVLHGLIWLSLCGYVRDDVDSILGAFFLGLYWLEDGLGA
ncbi:MAG: phosphotransferase [Pseudomonadota bacterium]